MTEVNVRVVAERWRKVRNEYATSDEDLRRSLNREAQYVVILCENEMYFCIKPTLLVLGYEQRA
jgi:hypothetical protein